MAGSGERFFNNGYTTSKPLLPVSNKPMIIQAAKTMPPAEEWIFVIRKEHLEEKEVLEALKSVSNNVKFVVDPNPQGQLMSALVAKEYCKKDEPLFVGSCDFGMLYDLDKYKELINSSSKIIAWTFTKDQSIKNNPDDWSYVITDKDNNISGLSLKKPISDNPYNDPANTGSFTFKSGNYFLKLSEELIKRKEGYEKELYVDMLIELAIEKGERVSSFTVDKYIGWGNPKDYERNKSFD